MSHIAPFTPSVTHPNFILQSIKKEKYLVSQEFNVFMQKPFSISPWIKPSGGRCVSLAFMHVHTLQLSADQEKAAACLTHDNSSCCCFLMKCFKVRGVMFWFVVQAQKVVVVNETEFISGCFLSTGRNYRAQTLPFFFFFSVIIPSVCLFAIYSWVETIVGQ